MFSRDGKTILSTSRDGEVKLWESGSGAEIQTFRQDGAGEFVLSADDCLYDTEQRTAMSAGPLKMMTADGRIQTEGQGFLWNDDAAVLTISNNVHTVIRDVPTETPKS